MINKRAGNRGSVKDDYERRWHGGGLVVGGVWCVVSGDSRDCLRKIRCSQRDRGREVRGRCCKRANGRGGTFRSILDFPASQNGEVM